MSIESAAAAEASACFCDAAVRVRKGVRISGSSVICINCHGVVVGDPHTSADMRWDGFGWQHWDGKQWVFAASGTETNEVGIGKPVVNQPLHGLAAAAHAGNLVVPVLPALVIAKTAGKRDEFVRHNSVEAMNFGITALLVWIAGACVTLALIVGQPSWFRSVLPWVVLALISWGLVYAYLVLAAANRTFKSRWFRYPMTARAIPGAETPQEITDPALVATH